MISISNNQDQYTLKNEYLTIKVNKKGAELSSLKSLKREYIWQANPEFWPRQAPTLFPIVGRLVDHEYLYEGKSYTLNQHGFAREADFNLIEKTEDSIVFELEATEKTKEIFPFDFILQVKYTLTDMLLVTSYKVINPSKTKDLYFSIGAHPAFNCPLEVGHKRNEYQLVFDKELALESDNIIDGLRNNTTTKIFDKKGKLSLPDSVFDYDAVIFNPNKFSKVTFVHKPTQKSYLSVEFLNYPYLGIWSSHRNSPFVCIEPWHGIADSINHNKNFEEKEGIIKLQPGKIFSCNYSIEVLDNN